MRASQPIGNIRTHRMRVETIFTGLPGRHSLSPHVSPSCTPILSCPHYFQAPATQARKLPKIYSDTHLSPGWKSVDHGRWHQAFMKTVTRLTFDENYQHLKGNSATPSKKLNKFVLFKTILNFSIIMAKICKKTWIDWLLPNLLWAMLFMIWLFRS